MQIRFTMLALLVMVAAGCASVRPRNAESQDFLLSFPNHLKPGEQVVGFDFDVRNSKIVAVNKVPHDWIITFCSEAADADMSGFPNHGASAFGNMAPLQGFVTIHKNLPQHFDVTGDIIVTKNFTRFWTNSLTKSDFILKRVALNTARGSVKSVGMKFGSDPIFDMERFDESSRWIGWSKMSFYTASR